MPREPRVSEDVIEPTFFLYENSEKSYSHHVQSPRVNVWRASHARIMHARLRTNIAGTFPSEFMATLNKRFAHVLEHGDDDVRPEFRKLRLVWNRKASPTEVSGL